MYGVLLTVLLLTTAFSPLAMAQDPFTPPPGDPFTPAPVDERLVEPLRLLAEVHDRDGQPLGEQYVALVRALNLTLAVAELRPGLAGSYNIPSRTVTISEAALTEDPRFVATALAHEIKHADDADFVGLGPLESDCVTIEARGFEVQAQIARAFWPDGLPTRTEFERELNVVVSLYEQGGLDALRGWVGRHAGYQQSCTVSAGVSDEALALGADRRTGEP